MAGQAQVIIGGEIQEGPAAQLHAGAGRGINAPQFAMEALLAHGGKAFIERIGEGRHGENLRFMIYGLRAKSRRSSIPAVTTTQPQPNQSPWRL